MKVENLKSYFISRSIKPMIILAVISLIWTGFYLIANFYQDKKVTHEQKVIDLNTQLTNIQNQIFRTKSAYDVWTKLVSNNFEMVGLRIQLAKKIIDDLRKLTLINDLEISLTNPVIRKDMPQNLVNVEYSELNLNFNCYTDIQAFKFIDGLNNKLPGILNYDILEMTSRDIIVDDNIINNIKDGQYKDLIKLKINLIWQDITTTQNSSIEGQK